MQNDQLYLEIYKRNLPVISLQTQAKIKKLRLAVAGCGSTGGAFIDGALRLGVTCYKIADNGSMKLLI